MRSINPLIATALCLIMLAAPMGASSSAAPQVDERVPLVRAADHAAYEGLGDPARPVEIALLEAAPFASPRHALEEIIEARNLQLLPALLPQRTTPTHEWTWGQPADDMTGDGLPDVVVLEARAPSFAVSARAGLDGDVAWQVDYDVAGFVWPQPVSDVDGDGLADVLVEMVDQGEARGFDVCHFGCRRVQEAEHTWRIQVLSGASGQTIWARDFPGFMRTASLAGVALFESRNLSIHAAPAGTVAGFSVSDISWQRAESSASLLHAYHAQHQGEVRGEILSLIDGRALLERRAEGAVTGGRMLPLWQPDETRAASFLWSVREAASCPLYVSVAPKAACEGVRSTALRQEIIDRATLETRAQARSVHAHHAWAQPWPADLDADGLGEVHVVARSWMYAEDRTSMLSGADLRVMWSTEGSLGYVPAGTLGGSLGEDVFELAHESLYVDGERHEQITIGRIDGATGERLFATTFLGPQGYHFFGGGVRVAAVEDQDADGARDLVVTLASCACTPTGGTSQTHLRVESGATGDAIAAHDFSDMRSVRVVGDLDGDALQDVLLVFVYPENMTWGGSEAFSLLHGPLWHEERVRVHVHAAGDVDGDGSDDLIEYALGHRDGSLLVRLDVVSGATGAILWGAGPQL